MTSGQRILVNALATYGRTLLAIFLGLFSSRWVLAALGDIDYGLMGVVGGILTFITFLNVISTNATARFFAFSVGRNDVDETRRWFNTALSFEIILPVSLVLIGFFVGQWAILHFLSIPADRLTTALWVFRFSLVTALVTMMCTPFTAMYTAKQNIAELSFWGMGISLTTFTFAYILTIIDGNHWLIYSAGVSLITITFMLLMSLRSYKKYVECKIVLEYMFIKDRLKQMTSFSIWTLFGTLGGIFYNVGTGIVLNKFFPPLQFPSVNASYSIGSTVRGHTANVSNALIGAFTPEIVSSEGRGDRGAVIRNIFRAERLSFLIISVISIPILFEVDFILKVWLKNPPIYAGLFCRALIIAFMIDSLIGGFNAAIQATGNIRNYQIILSSFAYLSIGVSALLLFFGGGLLSVCGVIIGYNVVNVIGNVIFCKRLVGISIRQWLNDVVKKIVICIGISVGMGFLLILNLKSFSDVTRFFIMSGILVLVSGVLSWLLLLDKAEKMQCITLFSKIKLKLGKRK